MNIDKLNNNYNIKSDEKLPDLPFEILTRLFIDSVQVNEVFSKNLNLKSYFSSSVKWSFFQNNSTIIINLIHHIYEKNIPFSKTIRPEDYYLLGQIFEQDPNSFFKEILKTNDNISLKYLLEKKDLDPTQENHFALTIAIKQANAEGLRLLLETQKFDIAFNNYEVLFSVLSNFNWEKKEQYNEMGQILLSHPQIDASARQNYAYAHAATIGWMEMILMLEKHDINPADQNNMALCNAASAGNVEVVKHLLTRVDPSFPDNTALIWACGQNQLEVVKILLSDQRVNHDTPDAVIEAIKGGHLEVIKVLSELDWFDLYSGPLSQSLKCFNDVNKKLDSLSREISSADTELKQKELIDQIDSTKRSLDRHIEIFDFLSSHPQFDPNRALSIYTVENAHLFLSDLFSNAKLKQSNLERSFVYALENGCSIKTIKVFLKNPKLPKDLIEKALKIVCIKNPSIEHEKIAIFLLNVLKVELTFDDQFLLRWAVFHNFNHLVERLLKMGTFDLRVQKHYCLKTALQNKNDELVKILINHKSYKFTKTEIIEIFKSIAPRTPPEKYQTIALLCVENPTKAHAKIAASLIDDSEFDLLFQDQTLLKWAVDNGFTYLTKKLIDKNLFNLSLPDDYYLKTAIRSGYKEIAALLLTNSKFHYSNDDLGKFSDTSAPNKPTKTKKI